MCAEEIEGAKQYFLYKERCVFCDIVRQEIEVGTRVVAENEDFLTLAPYAPRFPFETWILPKQHESAFENSSSHMFENLAKALKTLLTKADRVLDNPPYNLVIHSFTGAGSDQRSLSLAHRVHAEADQDGGIRVGNWLLHQSNAAGRSGEVPARGQRGRAGSGDGRIDLFFSKIPH